MLILAADVDFSSLHQFGQQALGCMGQGSPFAWPLGNPEGCGHGIDPDLDARQQLSRGREVAHVDCRIDQA